MYTLTNQKSVQHHEFRITCFCCTSQLESDPSGFFLLYIPTVLYSTAQTDR